MYHFIVQADLFTFKGVNIFSSNSHIDVAQEARQGAPPSTESVYSQTHRGQYLAVLQHILILYGIFGICGIRFKSVRARGYKTFFLLNSAEHETFSADKYENAN